MAKNAKNKAIAKKKGTMTDVLKPGTIGIKDYGNTGVGKGYYAATTYNGKKHTTTEINKSSKQMQAAITKAKGRYAKSSALKKENNG